MGKAGILTRSRTRLMQAFDEGRYVKIELLG
jgi:hypothetical protein